MERQSGITFLLLSVVILIPVHAANYFGRVKGGNAADSKKAALPVYRLPYAVGGAYRVIQGNNGLWGHTGYAEYAFDFQMPLGTPVHASRAGLVEQIQQGFADSTGKAGEDNFIFIRHSDHSIGRYLHLRQHGILVKPGDHVVAGQEIALSGDSGASSGPHLHFDVIGECAERRCQTLPITFCNVRAGALEQGESYRALPPAKACTRSSEKLSEIAWSGFGWVPVGRLKLGS